MVPKDFVDEVISSLFEDAVDPKISVVGVGGAGGKMVSALYDREIKGVETVAVNTDPAGLSKAECDVKILLPHSEDEDRVVAARVSAEDQEGALRSSLSSDIVFIVAGLGGAAGTGAAPVVARAARANGAVTVGIAILPFEVEGRTEVARAGLEALRGPALLQRSDAGHLVHGRHDREGRRGPPEPLLSLNVDGRDRERGPGN